MRFKTPLADLTTDQWNAVIHGDPQAKALETQEKRAVAVVGVARLKATTACFVKKFQEIETFKRNPAVLRIRRFVPPVDPPGLEGFSLEAGDVTDLRVCRVGNCKVTHVSIYVQPGRTVIASKRIYASYYFDASLGLTTATDDGAASPGSSMYLVYLNRSRIDLLRRFLEDCGAPFWAAACGTVCERTWQRWSGSSNLDARSVARVIQLLNSSREQTGHQSRSSCL